MSQTGDNNQNCEERTCENKKSEEPNSQKSKKMKLKLKKIDLVDSVPINEYPEGYSLVREAFLSINAAVVLVCKNNVEYVMKIIEDYRFNENEYIIPMSINNERIIKFTDMIRTDKYVFLVSPNYNLGFDLFEYLNEIYCKHKHDIVRRIFEILREILEAMVVLEKSNVCHLDIKLENFVVISKQPLKVVLVDFGSAKMSPTRTLEDAARGKLPMGKLRKAQGTPRYMSPEIYNYRYNNKSDVYSFGIVVKYITQEDSESISTARRYYLISEFSDYSRLIFDIVDMSIQDDPSMRKSASEILNYLVSNYKFE